MIQRIQTVYLLIAFIVMSVCAIMASGIVLVAIAAITAVGSVGTIFLYNKRPLQAVVCRCLCLLGLAYLVYATIIQENLSTPHIWVLALPMAAIICWILASKAIMKDEKLVRSLDRIR